MDDAPSSPPVAACFREVVTDALRYWEPRRLLYNAVLAVEVVGYFCAALPGSRDLLSLNGLFLLFLLASFANFCYCAAYVVDIFAQLSGFRPEWRRWRWLLLAFGVIFAAVITRFFCLGFSETARVD